MAVPVLPRLSCTAAFIGTLPDMVMTWLRNVFVPVLVLVGLVTLVLETDAPVPAVGVSVILNAVYPAT